METSILHVHRLKIVSLYRQAQITPESEVSTCDGSLLPLVTLSSFQDLLTYDLPINDSIIHSFLSVIQSSDPNIAFTDTAFHRHFSQHGWSSAFQTYFLHSESSRYTKQTQFKSTIVTPVIIIPIHIHGSHWVSIT